MSHSLHGIAASILLLPIICLAGCDSTAELPAELQRDIGTVQLKVDFGEDKRAKTIDVVCSEDSTVLLTLERAQNMKKLKFEFTGSGETAFIKSIDGVENEGADGKSWTYKVNGKLGDKSAGIFEVDPADEIEWTFGDRPKELN